MNDFCWALNQLKAGNRVRRRTAHATGVFVAPNPNPLINSDHLLLHVPGRQPDRYRAVQSDLFASDWELA